jgi:hypothetical protein
VPIPFFLFAPPVGALVVLVPVVLFGPPVEPELFFFFYLHRQSKQNFFFAPPVEAHLSPAAVDWT